MCSNWLIAMCPWVDADECLHLEQVCLDVTLHMVQVINAEKESATTSQFFSIILNIFFNYLQVLLNTERLSTVCHI